MRRLPPLNGLRAFEAAARHLSFTKAAEELFVTPAAVSHQIKALEDFFGVKLFRRLTRAVALTEEAQRILPLVSEGFDLLSDAGETLRAAENAGVLTVSTAPAIAARWLVPRLSRFAERHPDISVRIDAALAVCDFERDGVDLAIRFGRGPYPGLRTDALFEEEVFPVCAPSLVESPARLREPADLANVPLIHTSWWTGDDATPSWRMWLTALGLEDTVDWRRGLTFTTETLAVDATIGGQGVMLASSVVVADDLRAGRLVRPFEGAMQVPSSYWILTPERTADLPRIVAFREWLLEEAAESRQAWGWG